MADTGPTRDDFRDAVGWLYVHLHNAAEAKASLAGVCDPVGLVDALTVMLLGLAHISTGGEPHVYVDHMRDNLDDYLDEAGQP